MTGKLAVHLAWDASQSKIKKALPFQGAQKGLAEIYVGPTHWALPSLKLQKGRMARTRDTPRTVTMQTSWLKSAHAPLISRSHTTYCRLCAPHIPSTSGLILLLLPWQPFLAGCSADATRCREPDLATLRPFSCLERPACAMAHKIGCCSHMRAAAGTWTLMLMHGNGTES